MCKAPSVGREPHRRPPRPTGPASVFVAQICIPLPTGQRLTATCLRVAVHASPTCLPGSQSPWLRVQLVPELLCLCRILHPGVPPLARAAQVVPCAGASVTELLSHPRVTCGLWPGMWLCQGSQEQLFCKDLGHAALSRIQRTVLLRPVHAQLWDVCAVDSSPHFIPSPGRTLPELFYV